VKSRGAGRAKAAIRRYTAFKLQLGKLSPDDPGDVTIAIAKADLAALQTAWGYWLKQWSLVHGPRSERAAEARAMSGTLYNLATSKQRGGIVDIRVNSRLARTLGKASRVLLEERVLCKDETIAAAAWRATRALCAAAPAEALGAPPKFSLDETKAIARQRYRSGDSSHNSRVQRARAKLRKNQNSA
jgi:hypothetical protein